MSYLKQSQRNKIKLHSRLLIIVATAVFSFAVNGPAFGQDAGLISVFPGSVCHAQSGTNAPDLRHYVNGIKNTGKVPTWVTCPLSYQHKQTSVPTRFFIKAYVGNPPNSDEQMLCEAHNIASYTGATLEIASDTSKWSVNGYRYVSFGFDYAHQSVPTVRCLLPPEAFVFSLTLKGIGRQ